MYIFSNVCYFGLEEGLYENILNEDDLRNKQPPFHLFWTYSYTNLLQLDVSCIFMESCHVTYNNSYKPITNTVRVRARLCKLQKRVHSTRSHM